jgi:hypothetical protein
MQGQGSQGDGRTPKEMVGTARFELATPCTPSKCATRLRYVPMESAAVDDDDSVGFDFQILHQSAASGEDARQLTVSKFAFFTTESRRHGDTERTLNR